MYSNRSSRSTLCRALFALFCGLTPAHLASYCVWFFLLGTSSCSGQTTPLNLPPKVTPAAHSFSAPVPVDATVLFDGTSLHAWQKRNKTAAGWRVRNNYMEVRRLSGSIFSKKAFGDIQLHVEWATPTRGIGRGQHKGNSGVKLMGLYEVQILDSYENTTYPDGQAGAIYGQYAPLVNASRPAGAWQSFDILFRRPRFNDDGTLKTPAYLTVFHNGILIHNHVTLQGPTRGDGGYLAHADRLPIMLQNHRSKVRFRNIWVRDLE